MNNWQPIETAPRDGTLIDLWIINQDNDNFRITDAYWNKYDNAWWAPYKNYGEGGKAETSYKNTKTGNEMFEKATHWMPLPEPPQ